MKTQTGRDIDEKTKRTICEQLERLPRFNELDEPHGHDLFEYLRFETDSHAFAALEGDPESVSFFGCRFDAQGKPETSTFAVYLIVFRKDTPPTIVAKSDLEEVSKIPAGKKMGVPVYKVQRIEKFCRTPEATA